MQEKGKMKRFLYLLFILFILASCSEKEKQEGFSVVAVDFPSFDAARAILGGDDKLTMLLPPGTESHSYDPTPRDMVRISESDPSEQQEYRARLRLHRRSSYNP